MLIGGCGFRAKKDKNKTNKTKNREEKLKQHSPGKCIHFVTDMMKLSVVMIIIRQDLNDLTYK